MGLIASISVKFFRAKGPVRIISDLLAAGWQFPKDTVYYDHYLRPEDVGKQRIEFPASAWPEVQKIIIADRKKREKVTLPLQHKGTKVQGEFLFSSNQRLHITFFASQPRLKEGSRFTDYSWLLTRIICPLVDAGYTILEIQCRDDNY